MVFLQADWPTCRLTGIQRSILTNSLANAVCLYIVRERLSMLNVHTWRVWICPTLHQPAKALARLLKWYLSLLTYETNRISKAIHMNCTTTLPNYKTTMGASTSTGMPNSRLNELDVLWIMEAAHVMRCGVKRPTNLFVKEIRETNPTTEQKTKDSSHD